VGARVVLIGSGYMAEQYLLAAKSLQQIEVVGIASRNLLTAQKLADDFHIRVVSNSTQELISNLMPDVILVCVSELSTEEVLSSLIHFQIPIVAEKPVGLSLEQALRIEAMASEAGCPVYVALNRRMYSSTKQVMEAVESSIGNRFVRIIDQENQIAARNSGQPDLVVSKWMFANSIHLIDYIRFVCRGDVTTTSRKSYSLSADGWVMVSQIEFSSGDQALYTCYWNTPARWSVDISIGDRLWQLAPLESARVFTLNSLTPTEFLIDAKDLSAKPGIIGVLEETLNFLNGLSTTLCSISDANGTMSLIESIYAVD
jgi:predicted dehydrogenase